MWAGLLQRAWWRLQQAAAAIKSSDAAHRQQEGVLRFEIKLIWSKNST
jgi:hypothetical protein